jgi:hypothetical protein
LRKSRNWIDSGSAIHISTPMTSGIAPPTKNTARQPKAGISAAVMRPPTTPPTVKPHETIIMSVTRTRRGLYSPASAMALGMMQPSPSPATKRQATSCSIDCANPVASMQTEKNSVAPISTGRRPILSASVLKVSEPTSMPKRPAPNTGASVSLAMPHSRITTGAT